MKKLLLGAGFFTLLSTVSCSKRETETPFVKGPSSWLVLNTTFNATSVTVATATNTITAANNSGEYFNIIFNNLPKSDGTYKIVSDTPKNDECALAAGSHFNDLNIYSSTGDGDAIAKVSISGAKIRVEIIGDADGISSYNQEHTTLGCDITETQRK